MAKLPKFEICSHLEKDQKPHHLRNFLRWLHLSVIQKVSGIADKATHCVIQDIGQSMVTSILLCDFVSEAISSRGIPACVHIHTADLQPLLAAHSAPTPWGICWALPVQQHCSWSDGEPRLWHRKGLWDILKIVSLSETKLKPPGHQLLPLILGWLWG